jgi:hypothetical protein
MSTARILAAAAVCAAAVDASASCGAAFCLVNTDWSAQGTWTEPGVRFDLKYESIDLDQPRVGRERVSVGALPREHDEIETRNRNVVGTVDFSLTPLWGVSIAVPYVDRKHFHLHNGEGGEQEPERWNFRELGDMRVQARYVFSEFVGPELVCQQGLTFGLKLPTGKHDVVNEGGEAAERSLQPGTGTTDALLGYYWHKSMPPTGWSYFTRANVVLPLNSRDDYKPGRQLQLDAGVRYAVSSSVGAMVQANYVAKGRDSGANAEPEDSGQRAVYVSPGISWNVGRNTQVYGFVQVPVYQAVNGLQLTADWSAVVGVSSRF